MNIRGFFKEEDNTDRPVMLSKPNCLKCGLDKHCKSPRMGITGKGKKKIFVFAEAPGAEEDAHGKQLIGEAGQLFRKYLKKHNIELDRDCWKINSVNCRPPDNREPTDKEIRCCRPMVEEALLKTKPKVILILGTKALQSHFAGVIARKHLTITNWTQHRVPDYRYNAWVVPIFHPEALLHNPNDILDVVFEKNLKWALSCLEIDLPEFDNPEKKITCVTDYSNVIDILEELNESEYLFQDLETSGLKPYVPGHKIYTIGLCGEKGNVYAFPYDYPHWDDKQKKQIHKKIKKLLSNPNIKNVAQNLKFENKWDKHVLGVESINWFWCTMTAQHCIDTRRFQTRLDFQALLRYGQPDYGEELGSFKKGDKTGFNTMHKVPLKQLLKYNATDVFYLRKLFFDQQEYFNKRPKMKWFYTEIFHKGTLSLAKSEDAGIPVNAKYFSKQTRKFEESLKEQEDALINKTAGLKFRERFGRNIDIQSAKDLRALFYDILKIENKKKTQKGTPSVDEYVLSHMDNTFAKDLIRYRKTKKVYDYVSEYNRSNVDGYLHPSIDLNHAASGRSNSSDPNLQNVPVRDEESAKIIRGGFIPSPGNLLIEADFKAIEVRVMACYTHDPVLISYILDETKDMHRDQAMKIFKLKENEITKQIRHIGKNDFVFPEFYGDWHEKCAKSAWEDCDSLKTKSGIPVKEHLANQKLLTLTDFKRHMKIVEKDFWDMLKITKDWRQEIVNDYLKKGYVDTFFGFRRTGYLEKNQIINTPVQGTAFHCLLWAYNRLTALFEKMKLLSKLIGQIHDSILADVHPSEKETVIRLMKRVMEKEIIERFDWIIVPLAVEIEATAIDMPWNTKKEISIES